MKQNNDLISIVIPIYNVEKYLKRCVDSVINQTYKNIEIIVVNDGSNDHTQEICEKICQEDTRVILINKKNGGVSSARNKGIDLAKGEYISFCDSDDYVDQSIFEKLLKLIKENDADISMCNIEYIGQNGETINNYKKNEKKLILDRKQFISKLMDPRIYFTFPFGKLVKRKVIKDIRYREDIYYDEDGLFWFNISENINKAVFDRIIIFIFLCSNTQ